MVDVSKPFSDEMEKLPKDSTEENRAEQKGVGMVVGGVLELVSDPIKSWAMESGRASGSQICGDSNGSEVLSRTLMKNQLLAAPTTHPLWGSL